jgi:hypothetical protein
MVYASPHITLEEWMSSRKSDIDLFEDQLRTWLFEQAAVLAPGQHSGPAILALVTPYFEAIACYLAGESSKGAETKFLRQGLAAVFPQLPQAVIDEYITEVRHGFAHEAVFRKVMIHRGGPNAPSLGLLPGGVLSVDPWWLLAQAESHFTNYVTRLRTGSDAKLLENFHAFMEVRKQR